jgi:hypothetical protein
MDLRLLLPLIPALLLGCRRAKTEPTGKLDLETWTEQARDGWLEVQVDVTEAHGAFMVSAQTEKEGAYLSVEEVYDPSGNLVMSWEDWYESDEWIGEPFFAWYKDVFFNWPIRAEDGPLTPGTWSVIVTAVDDWWTYVPAELELSVQRKKDSDPDNGTVQIWIVYAKGIEKEDGVAEAVEGAVEHWERMWQPYGLKLEVEYGNMPGMDPALPIPGENSDEIEQLSARSNGEQIILVIGETVDGDQWTYGMAGGIPGPMVPSDRSAIAISWLVHAGKDASFDEEEIRVFGGSLAHEVGHYMGLCHPVEDGYESWDALADTPTCSNQSSCEEQLGSNLMFPYSICDWTSCAVQERLTDDQVVLSQQFSAAL